MSEREPAAGQSTSSAADDLWPAFAALRAKTTLGPGLTIKELVETGRR